MFSLYEGQRGSVFESSREVVDSFSFLGARFSIDYLTTVSRKRFFRDLLDISSSEALHHSLLPRRSGRHVLGRAEKLCIPPCSQSLSFKLRCVILPLEARMQAKRMVVRYFLCKVPKIINHIFIHCQDPLLSCDIFKKKNY